MLQCGLGPKTEEIGLGGGEPDRAVAASMWPRSEDRGNLA